MPGMTEPRDTLRVSKKFLPGQPGTLKLARKHGDALVFVRYRVDAEGLHRYTTVELVVDHDPIVKWVDRIVGVRVFYEETTLQLAVRAGGAMRQAGQAVARALPRGPWAGPARPDC